MPSYGSRVEPPSRREPRSRVEPRSRGDVRPSRRGDAATSDRATGPPASEGGEGVSPTRRDPLEGIDRLLVDGTNLLHALRRGSGTRQPAPAVALIGRLRSSIPAAIGIEIVLDGPPEPGSGNLRVASGVIVRYAGRVSADVLLVRLVAEAAQGSIEQASNILVVTDDGALGADIRRRGATTARAAWLIRRLERATAAAPSVGRPKPPPTTPADDDEGDTRRWAPGRGATTKRGNPRRASKARNAPPSG